ncbi:hypothetical protein ACN27G_14575 [Plantactinospora sp. WMMB334]|uniref:hypothetical protein n=1 Tax=Plantactinospora sp. WMMB334 TaxID=3404119 RepID=UPI003B94A2BB
MGRWSGSGNRSGPERWLGPATMFAAGRGAYAKETPPDRTTEPTDEQSSIDRSNPSAPANRSVRFRMECGADRGYPPGWR